MRVNHNRNPHSKVRQLLVQILPPFLYSCIKKISQRKKGVEELRVERELFRIAESRGNGCGRTSIFGGVFEYIDAQSFLSQYKAFFQRKIYLFSAATKSPRIIDCGANMGVSVMWWKHLYPNAQIVAFEADPAIFDVLKRNCAHLPGVTLHNCALWNSNGEMPFTATGGEGGRIVEGDDQLVAEHLSRVNTVSLRTFLSEGCDFLKIDIEGAEVAVLEDCKDLLKYTRAMFLEYHSFFHKRQSLGRVCTIIEEAGFRIHVHVEIPSPSPFVELLNFNQKDLRLDLFCFKDGEYPTVRVLG